MNSKLSCIALCAALALGTAGCGQRPGGGVNIQAPTPEQLAQIEATAKTIAQATCAFVPTAATIAGIVSANPGVQTGAQVAAIACGFVNNLKVARRAPRAGDPIQVLQVGKYHGPRGVVTIKGYFAPTE